MGSDDKQPLYKRVIIKYSGEALLGDNNASNIDSEIIKYIANEIKTILDVGTQVGIVVGGGNLFRGASLCDIGIDRVVGDKMGMLATVINSLAIQDIFEKQGIKTKIMSSIPVMGIVDVYDRKEALKNLNDSRVLLLAGGIGNPLVTADTALGLRGIELHADVLLKATGVDGVYSSDPTKDSDAKLYEEITYDEALSKKLAIMDLLAFCLCKENDINLRVFNMHKVGALLRIVMGANEGTLVRN